MAGSHEGAHQRGRAVCVCKIYIYTHTHTVHIKFWFFLMRKCCRLQEGRPGGEKMQETKNYVRKLKLCGQQGPLAHGASVFSPHFALIVSLFTVSWL